MATTMVITEVIATQIHIRMVGVTAGTIIIHGAIAGITAILNIILIQFTVILCTDSLWFLDLWAVVQVFKLAFGLINKIPK